MTPLDRLEALEKQATPEGYRTKRNAIEYATALNEAAPALIAVARAAVPALDLLADEAEVDGGYAAVHSELKVALARLDAEAPDA